jgi:hypothetical protein
MNRIIFFPAKAEITDIGFAMTLRFYVIDQHFPGPFPKRNLLALSGYYLNLYRPTLLQHGIQPGNFFTYLHF